MQTTFINDKAYFFWYLITNFPFKPGMKYMFVDYNHDSYGIWQSTDTPYFVNGPFWGHPRDGEIEFVGYVDLQKCIVPFSHKDRLFDVDGKYPLILEYQNKDINTSTYNKIYNELKEKISEEGLKELFSLK